MNYDYIDECPPQKVFFDTPGRYKIEVWGAKGGGKIYFGRGAYSSGILDVRKPFVAFLYVGGSGGMPTAGCNGGGTGGIGFGEYEPGGGGGGSTDLRLLDDYSHKALASRLIVAGGGGGAGGNGSGTGSDAGAETSNQSISLPCGTSSPGVLSKGALLYGEDGFNGIEVACQYEGKGAGGGGFIGGHSSQSYVKSAGSGGTSYVAPSLSDPIILTGDDVPEKSDDGKARITFLGPLCQTRKNKQQLTLDALWMLSLSVF